MTAFDWVCETVKTPHPRVILRQLARQAEELYNEGQDIETIRAALLEWDARPGASPSLLPHLISDILRSKRSSRRDQEQRQSMLDWERELLEEMGG